MRLLLVMVFVSGCAMGVVARPDGTTVKGIAFGDSTLECCDKGLVSGETCTTIKGPKPASMAATVAGGVLRVMAALLPFFFL